MNELEGLARPERTHIYENPAADSGRWSHWRPRKGDIFVCTPPKTGTTWTQMLCALLVHQSPRLPQPLTRLSRWLERHTEPIAAVIADLESQSFRRIVKTHTPIEPRPPLVAVVRIQAILGSSHETRCIIELGYVQAHNLRGNRLLDE